MVLIDALKQGEKDPMKDNFLILNAVEVSIRSSESRRVGERRTPRRVGYWTFDHRRLFCLRQAGCTRVRLRIQLSGRAVDEMFNKAMDCLGCRTTIHVSRGMGFR